MKSVTIYFPSGDVFDTFTESVNGVKEIFVSESDGQLCVVYDAGTTCYAGFLYELKIPN